ncbi:restriction endonuclease [Microcoleus vaginatus PCC 9802]|uniref:McrC family protein n=1 Tax=Microcoleus vaginatus TaxID=119532 RepID=UPI00020D23F7|nr:5-methylcytosine restriction system component-like protein [Microcoleus vaginatus FGP-2]UNU21614.1 restriction endonuclease [Microcoleus vaginatus PCC 9802]
MKRESPQIIELTEYQSATFDRNSIPELVGEKIYQNYAKEIEIEFPNPKTKYKWQLKSKGRVGNIPITPEFHIAIRPKVPINNLFGMLDYAYNLKIKFPQGSIQCQSLQESYEKLANILAQKILERCRKGLYRDYLSKTERLAYIRGRVDLRSALQKPWDVKLKCHYNEQTGDIEDNQILAWTLFIIGRSGLCRESVSSTVRKAFHALQGFVTLKPFKSEACIDRNYHRLNQDYQLLHALCRFFLDNTGPSHETGDREMLPFLIDMANLYEQFVAEWLKANTPKRFFVKQQHRVTHDQNYFDRIDLLLGDSETKKVQYVLDTKYKAPDKVANNDIHQIVAYANALKCQNAILVYPQNLKQPLDIKNDDIRVRSLTFSLDSDLNEAGKTFLKSLLANTLPYW